MPIFFILRVTTDFSPGNMKKFVWKTRKSQGILKSEKRSNPGRAKNVVYVQI